MCRNTVKTVVISYSWDDVEHYARLGLIKWGPGASLLSWRSLLEWRQRETLSLVEDAKFCVSTLSGCAMLRGPCRQ